ncbi:TolC family protein [Desulfosarcina variabilis]|uniref:TolC family protein n=1 Tax=Desulfosarcina variabilis TaxID=2300 RepID=UPI003AFB07C6
MAKLITRPCLSTLALLVCLLAFSPGSAQPPPPDPLTMDQAVTLAIANNRLIKSALQKSWAAEAGRDSARADLLPKAAAEYTYTRFKDQPFMWVDAYTVDPNLGIITGTQSHQKTISDKNLTTWNLTLTQPLFTGFALSTRLKMAALGVRTRQIESIIAVQDVTKLAKLAYIHVLLAQKILTVAQQAEKSIRAHAHNAGHLYQQGMIPYHDQLQANVALADAAQQRVAQAAQCQMAISALNTVLDLDIDHATQVAEIDPHASGPTPDLTALLDAVLEDRPELKALDLARQQLELGRVLARSGNYPTVALVGQYRQRGDDWAATQNNYDNQHNAIVGLQAQWTFFEWGKTRAEEARVRHDQRALEEKIKSVGKAMQLEVKDAYTRLQVARQNVGTADAALVQAQENLRIVNLRYTQQMATSTDVLDATTRLTQAKTNYFVAGYGCHSAMAELERAVGRRLEPVAP